MSFQKFWRVQKTAGFHSKPMIFAESHRKPQIGVRHLKTNVSGDCPGGGGAPDWVARGLPTGGQGSKVYVLCAEPKEHKLFRPGTRPGGSGTWAGGSVTGVTEKSFMCQMFMCLFRPLF